MNNLINGTTLKNEKIETIDAQNTRTQSQNNSETPPTLEGSVSDKNLVATVNFDSAKNLQGADEVGANCETNIAKRDEENLNILGKFKSVATLAKAYENLQAEFTRKSQLLSKYEHSAYENLDLKTDDKFNELSENLDTDNTKNEGETAEVASGESTLENQKNSEKMQKSEEKTQKINVFSRNLEKNAHLGVEQEEVLTQQNDDENELNNLENLQNEQSKNDINQQIKQLCESGVVSKDIYGAIVNKFMENSALIDNPNGVTEAVLSLFLEHSTQYDKQINDPEFIVNLAKNNKQAHDEIIRDYVEECSRKKVPPLMTRNFGANIAASTPSTPTTLTEARDILEKLLLN